MEKIQNLFSQLHAVKKATIKLHFPDLDKCALESVTASLKLVSDFVESLSDDEIALLMTARVSYPGLLLSPSKNVFCYVRDMIGNRADELVDLVKSLETLESSALQKVFDSKKKGQNTFNFLLNISGRLEFFPEYCSSGLITKEEAVTLAKNEILATKYTEVVIQLLSSFPVGRDVFLDLMISTSSDNLATAIANHLNVYSDENITPDQMLSWNKKAKSDAFALSMRTHMINAGTWPYKGR